MENIIEKLKQIKPAKRAWNDWRILERQMRSAFSANTKCAYASLFSAYAKLALEGVIARGGRR